MSAILPFTARLLEYDTVRIAKLHPGPPAIPESYTATVESSSYDKGRVGRELNILYGSKKLKLVEPVESKIEQDSVLPTTETVSEIDIKNQISANSVQIDTSLEAVQASSSPAMPLDATYPNNKWKPSQHDIEVSDYPSTSLMLKKVGQLSGKNAVAFLTKSNLDRGYLRQIWELSDTQKQHYLGKKEFQIAMRLVTLAQNGYLPSPTVLDETKDVIISKEPQFDGIRPFFTSTNTNQIDGSSALISATQVRAGLQGGQVASSPAMPWMQLILIINGSHRNMILKLAITSSTSLMLKKSGNYQVRMLRF